MSKFKRLMSVLLIGVMTCGLLSGCNKKEESEVPQYSLVSLTADQLQEGKYYVKNGETFYELPAGTRTFTDEREQIAKQVDKSRVIWFGGDDVCIPTLYKDDTLVFVTSALPDEFTWERFYDNGYSFGVCGLEANSTGSYGVTMEGRLFYPNSSMKTAIAASGAEVGSFLVYDAIDTFKIGNENVSKCGSIIGLTYNKAYNVDVYNGSKYLPLEGVIADTHVFNSYELYNSSICNYMQSNYIQVVVPDEFVSGYYLINGIGFVKYVDGPRSKGVTNVDFNAPYFLYDENGNMYTADQVDQDTGAVIVEPDKYYSSSVSVDCSNRRMTVTMSYMPAEKQNVDGSTITLSDKEVGIPEVKIYDPDGNESIFVQSYEKENTLQCVIENPVPGNWEVKIWNAESRMFSLNTEFESGHNDTLLHQGQGKGEFVYYLTNSLNDGLFTVTWTDTNKYADSIVIEDEEGNVYDRETLGSDYKEERGYTQLRLGKLKYGEYKIIITGDNLGRVRVTTQEASGAVVDTQPVAETTPEPVVETTETQEVPATDGTGAG